MERNDHFAQDVDLLCLYSEDTVRNWSESFYQDFDFLKVVTSTIDHLPNSPREPVEKYVEEEALKRIYQEVEKSGITINVLFLPQKIFLDTERYPVYRRFVENAKAGKVLFSSGSLTRSLRF